MHALIGGQLAVSSKSAPQLHCVGLLLKHRMIVECSTIYDSTNSKKNKSFIGTGMHTRNIKGYSYMNIPAKRYSNTNFKPPD